MNNLAQAIQVELLKARRSKMPLFSVLAFLMIPAMGGFFMLILQDPALAQRMGLISAKAQLMAGTADWPTYLQLLAQAIAVGGIILFGFIGSWLFGREYSDHTLKDLLALPTSRSTIVMAKFVVLLTWLAVLVSMVYLVGMAVGSALKLPAPPAGTFQQGTWTIAISAALTIILVTPIAFFASAGHGYLPALGAAILAIVLANIFAVTGWGEYFPWTVPALISQGEHVGLISYLIVLLASVAGVLGTLAWWESADQVY